MYSWGKEAWQLGIKGAQSSEFAKILPAFDHERELPQQSIACGNFKSYRAPTMCNDNSRTVMMIQTLDISADTLLQNLGNEDLDVKVTSNLVAQRKYAQLASPI